MRLKSSLVAAGLAAALALAGCAGGPAPTTDPGGSPSAAPSEAPAQGSVALTVAKPDGPITEEMNNPWVNDASAMRLGYINALMEPLGIVNLIKPEDPIRPWLASEIAWSPDYKSVTLTARDGVTWNDGQPFTAQDIAFTFNLFLEHPELDLASIGLDKVSPVDGNKVTLSFKNSMYVKQDKVLHKLIAPKHIWEKVADPVTETNPNPVGTGPYTLGNFSSQSVELTARDDYWGGTPAVPTLYYVSYADNTALTTALASGDADWGQAFIPNVQTAYVEKDAEHNVYWAAAGLGIDTMFVNTTTKPFNDLAFRKAIDMVIDRTKHQAIAREGGVPLLSSITGLPTPGGDAFILPAYQGKSYAVDVDGAKKVLADAGYTLDGGTLVDPDGEKVTFDLTVPQGWNDYVTGISLIADSVKALGIEATVTTPDADSWWANKSNGDFDAILHWTDTGATPYDIYSDLMDGRWLKKIGEPADFNFGRFDDPTVTKALDDYANATDDAARQAALEIIQTTFVEQVPAMPIGTRPFLGQYNTRNYVGWPGEDDPYTNPDPTQPSAVLILTSLKPVANG